MTIAFLQNPRHSTTQSKLDARLRHLTNELVLTIWLLFTPALMSTMTDRAVSLVFGNDEKAMTGAEEPDELGIERIRCGGLCPVEHAEDS